MIAKKDLTFQRLLVIWWAMTWRAVVFVLGGSMVFGFILGVILALIGLVQHAKLVGYIIGLPLGFFGGLWALRESLTRSYEGFELTLDSKAASHF